MNLAIASPAAPGYSETFIRMQIEGLPCAMTIHGEPVATETVPGGPIEPLRSLRGLRDTAIEFGLRRGKRLEGAHVRELVRRLRALRIDRMLANYGPTGVALMPVCKALEIPLVVHFHGYDAHMTASTTECREAYAELGKHAAAVVAVSGPMVQALSQLGIPKEKISLLRYGVDPGRFRIKRRFPPDPIFFGVGRFVDKKAPYLTLLAFQRALHEVPGARLVLAGDGPLLDATRNLADALGVSAVVEFPGVLRPEEVAERMAGATAFVQHSIVPRYGKYKGDSEGTPVAVLEALMTGLPVISTRHAGIEEVVTDGTNGLLVDERDVASMTRAMVRLALEPQFGANLGAAARKVALEGFTAGHYLDGLSGVLEEAGSGSGGKS